MGGEKKEMFEEIKEELVYQRDKFNLFVADKKAQMNLTEVGLGIGILVIISMVVLYITNEVYDIAAITSGSVFYTGVTKVIKIINTGYGMLLIAVLALLTGLIIFYLRGAFAGGPGGPAAGGGGGI